MGGMAGEVRLKVPKTPCELGVRLDSNKGLGSTALNEDGGYGTNVDVGVADLLVCVC